MESRVRLVDSHCHLDQLDLNSYQGELDQAIEYAKQKGVVHFLCVCITLADFDKMFSLVKKYSEVDVSVGLHPNEEVIHEPTVEELIQLAANPKVIAIGETGLDYYRTTGDAEWQRDRFRTHIRTAKALNKPLIVHSRQAKSDTIAIMRDENASEISGVMHCFTEDWAMAKEALDLNFYISFSGIVTFRNAKEIQEVAKKVPLDRLLIETDSPYLAPEPHRGKPNEPAYVRYVAEQLATLRGISVEELGEKTTENFYKLFKGC